MNDPESVRASVDPVANEKPGSFGFFFLVVAMVGAYSALFIPALAGVPVNPQFGTASMFWNGLFFYSLWGRRGRSGWKGAMIGVLVGIVAFGAAGFVSGFVRASTGHH